MTKQFSNLGLVIAEPNTLARERMLVIGGAAITAICAQIVIPLQPVPVTLQTFAVLLCGVMLGPRLGVLSQLLYLGAGACGAPIFARADFGPQILIGPTAGYLISFPIAAALIGWLSARGWDKNVWSLLLAMGMTQALILVSGASWLAFYVGGVANAWRLGVQPFLLVELLKGLVLAAGIPAAWKAVNKD